MKTRKNIKQTQKRKNKTNRKNKRNDKRNNKKNKNKNKTNRKNVGGTSNQIKHLFFDKYNVPPINLNLLIRNSYTSSEFSPDNILSKLNEDQTTKQGRDSSSLYLTTQTGDKIVGYISGYVYDELGVISFVEFHQSIRGLGLCTQYLNKYLKLVLETHPNIETYQLFNVGGERACRCYVKAFEQNGFSFRDAVNCKDLGDEVMYFDKNVHEFSY